MDIHVGMMLKFPVGNLLGWIVDDTPKCRVQWANGAVTQQFLVNIYVYRQRWLELEEAHERLSIKD